VRHAAPAVDEHLPAARWPLSGEGRAEALLLAKRLADFNIETITTSTELKAIQTGECLASVLGAEVRSDERLGEVERPWVKTGFENAVVRYFHGEQCDGWEPQAVVTKRLTAALDDLRHQFNAVIVTHGTALTTYLATVATIAPESFWRELRLPDAWAFVDGDLTRIGAV
jgi:broad specificity phosphatase PhoE